MAHIRDISVLVWPGMPTFPGEQGPRVKPDKEIVEGEPASVSILSLGTHTGTHVDPPSHFLTCGPTVEAVPLEALVGRAVVVALETVDKITAQDLDEANLPEGAERILFKTRNSRLWDLPGFQTSFVGLSVDAALWLVERRVRLVGIDYLSIEPFHGSGDTHRTLLGGGAMILEGLDLRGVEPGEYILLCLPLKLDGGDGGPARAILLDAMP